MADVAGMERMPDGADVMLYFTSRRKDEQGEPWSFDGAVAEVSDVNWTRNRNLAYRAPTWGSRQYRFYTEGIEKITGKFIFEAITKKGWDMLRSRRSGEKEEYLEITGVVTDDEHNTIYSVTLYNVHIDSVDASLKRPDGPGDMPYSFTAQRVDTHYEAME